MFFVFFLYRSNNTFLCFCVCIFFLEMLQSSLLLREVELWRKEFDFAYSATCIHIKVNSKKYQNIFLNLISNFRCRFMLHLINHSTILQRCFYWKNNFLYVILYGIAHISAEEIFFLGGKVAPLPVWYNKGRVINCQSCQRSRSANVLPVLSNGREVNKPRPVDKHPQSQVIRGIFRGGAQRGQLPPWFSIKKNIRS